MTDSSEAATTQQDGGPQGLTDTGGTLARGSDSASAPTEISKIAGYVERVFTKERLILGWAAIPGSTEIPTVTVSLAGKTIAVGRPEKIRPDLQRITGVPAGFALMTDEDITPSDVLAGRIEVRASGESTSVQLRLTDAGKRHATSALAESTQPSGHDAGTPPIAAPQPLETSKKAASPKQTKVSPVLVATGFQSKDATAAIGRDGQLFLIGGSNNLADLYEIHGDRAAEFADHWSALIASRANSCALEGIDFIQMIIPEKLTVLRELAPLEIHGPSPVLREIETFMGQSPVYFSGLRSLSEWEQSEPPYRPNDTHLTATGAQHLFSALSERLQPGAGTEVSRVNIDTQVVSLGDLSHRFFDTPILAKVMVPRPEEVALLEKNLELVLSHDPATGFIGRRRIWRNPTALIQKKVYAFANSFFGEGSNPGSLSWWSARFFAEFHLIWDPEVDNDYLDREGKPDVLIAQTVERFLTRVPKR
ncbi:hypothetical protein ACFVTM_16645 [Arthrobacter sp. NPDC058130]|uniref:hypothetical protein n=1 Tax=Arthrobacter sp. NPDC058130 TaxID=3346353 RepID=UPI0036E129CA